MMESAMKLVPLAQSTPEWLDWRKAGITASDVSCLFHTNPYKTEWKLWAEKSGLQAEDDIEGNPFVRRGKTFEHMLREHVVNARNVGIMPACAEHGTVPYLRASLDGIDRNRRPWEFKIPSPNNFEEVRKHQLNSEPAKRAHLQVQHQLLVTGASEGYLVFGNIDDSGRVAKVTEYILLIIPADPELHQAILEKSLEFMRRLAERDEPPKDPDRDLFAPQSGTDAVRWQEAAAKVLPLLALKADLKVQISAVEKQLESAARPILDVLGSNKAGEFAGLRAIRVDRTGSVDWTAFVKAHGFDPTDETLVGPFRKAGSSNHQFTAL
jgi:putative phage-type endonuclease